MSLKIASVGSSSSGNSYIIRTDRCNLILDVGLPAKTIVGALCQMGCEPDDVDAVLVTHEHTDHVKSVRAISRKCPGSVFIASRGTVEAAACFSHVSDERINYVKAGESISIGTDGEVVIKAFALSHDSKEPLSYTVTTGGEKLAVVTDTGIITDDIYDEIVDADHLVFEANHDLNMLMFGEYPYNVKQRIKSDLGHMSNEYAAEVLANILEDRRDATRPLAIMLAHLSFNNNAPIFARQAVEEAFESRGFKKGADYTLEIATKEGLTFMDQV